MPAFGEPYVLDPNFIVEKYVTNLEQPSTMSFIGDDILVLEYHKGDVRLVKNGILQDEPVMHFDVARALEQGLLGITTQDSSVFLYLTAADSPGGEAIENRIYRFTWNGTSLQDGILVHQLPVHPEGVHNGGAMVTSEDGTVYAVMGDVGGFTKRDIEREYHDDKGIIFRVEVSESDSQSPKLEIKKNNYVGMGIRNSFGIAVDPITGYIWDTENGFQNYDEINLMKPKTNSGWPKVQGPVNEIEFEKLSSYQGFEYSNPEFSWEYPIAPTGITFVNSELFNEYRDSVLVGDALTGTIHKFKLNSERTGFIFDDPQLKDLVLNDHEFSQEMVFSTGYSVVSDLEFGPDGILYIVSLGDGTIYRIIPIDFLTKHREEKLSELKNNAMEWSKKQIDDTTFIQNIENMIENNVIRISSLPEDVEITGNFLPTWFKKNAGWWSDELISNEEFVYGIKFLIEKGTIHLTKYSTKCDVPLGLGVDLSGCDLSGKVFSEINLSHSNLKNSNLANTKFEKTKMVFADFSGADLSNAVFINPILQGAKFQNSVLKGITLEEANLVGSTMTGADLTEAKLSKANLKGSDLQNAILTHADLSGADMRFTNFTNANFMGANLTEAILAHSILENSIFVDADLSGAILRNTNIKNADLTGATLTRASFSLSNLQDAIGEPFTDCLYHRLCLD